MAIKHMTWAFDLDWHFDSSAQHHIFLVMAYYADRKQMIVRLSQSELAQMTLLSRATVVKEIGRLQEIGLLKRLGHGRYGLRYVNGDEVEAKTGGEQKKYTREDYSNMPCAECGDVTEGDYEVRFNTKGEPRVTHSECASRLDRERGIYEKDTLRG